MRLFSFLRDTCKQGLCRIYVLNLYVRVVPDPNIKTLKTKMGFSGQNYGNSHRNLAMPQNLNSITKSQQIPLEHF